MTHFGLICLPYTGHLNPMTTLGHELQQRGHRVTLFGVLDTQSKALAAGLNFWAIGEFEFPSGVVPAWAAQTGKLTGFAAVRHTSILVDKLVALHFQELPQVLKKAGVEALLVDQTLPEGGTIAEFLDIPFITVCIAVPMNQDDNVPLYTTHWRYNPAWWALLRNRGVWALINLLNRIEMVSFWKAPVLVAEYRRKWKLPLYSTPNDAFSQLAQVSQQPAEFEFPRANLPQYFHFMGPFSNPASREPIAFAWEKLTGQPLIYASMGTIQNGLPEIFQKIAEACVGLDAQLVMSLGGATSSESLPKLPGSPLVVKYAPQLELLKKASLTITHAGMNTVLESLSYGVPLVAIPITYDHPGIAARLAWTGAGEFVRLADLSDSNLRAAIRRVLNEDSYKQNATRLQKAIARAGGVSRAADIVEIAISTRKPVLSHSEHLGSSFLRAGEMDNGELVVSGAKDAEDNIT